MAVTPARAGLGGLGVRALLFTAFDEVHGHQMRCSDPPDAIGAELFKSVSAFFLTRREARVEGRVVSLLLGEFVLLGAPIVIEHARYDRNIFQYNVCAVISSSLDRAPYKDLAQHLASAFRVLEDDMLFLSSDLPPATPTTPPWTSKVQPLLASIRAQLNASGECFVRVSPTSCVSFRVRVGSQALGPEPKLEDVPVPLVDLQSLASAALGNEMLKDEQGAALTIRLLDPVLVRVMKEIDGVRTVDGVVQESGLDAPCVLLCLRHLRLYRLVDFIDDVQLGKSYRLTPGFHEAFLRKQVKEEVAAYITGGRRDDAALVGVALRLYAKIGDAGYSATLGQFQRDERHDLESNDISLRHFITFGLLHRFVELVEWHPLTARAEDEKRIRKTLTLRKVELKNDGLSEQVVNAHPDIKDFVAQLNSVRGKATNT